MCAKVALRCGSLRHSVRPSCFPLEHLFWHINSWDKWHRFSSQTGYTLPKHPAKSVKALKETQSTESNHVKSFNGILRERTCCLYTSSVRPVPFKQHGHAIIYHVLTPTDSSILYLCSDCKHAINQAQYLLSSTTSNNCNVDEKSGKMSVSVMLVTCCVSVCLSVCDHGVLRVKTDQPRLCNEGYNLPDKQFVVDKSPDLPVERKTSHCK